MSLFNTQSQEILSAGKELVAKNLTSGTGGNISFCDRDKGLILITPSGFDLAKMTEHDLVIIDFNGKIIKGVNKPSSEWAMHAAIYKNRPDLNYLIHIHAIYTTVLACQHQDLPASHYMVAVAGKNVRVSKYATFGSSELAKNAILGMEDRKAVMLANHGLIGGETTMSKTLNVVEEVEYCAKIYCLANISGQKPKILSDEEMEHVLAKFQTYGPK